MQWKGFPISLHSSLNELVSSSVCILWLWGELTGNQTMSLRESLQAKTCISTVNIWLPSSHGGSSVDNFRVCGSVRTRGGDLLAPGLGWRGCRMWMEVSGRLKWLLKGTDMAARGARMKNLRAVETLGAAARLSNSVKKWRDTAEDARFNRENQRGGVCASWLKQWWIFGDVTWTIFVLPLNVVK